MAAFRIDGLSTLRPSWTEGIYSETPSELIVRMSSDNVRLGAAAGHAEHDTVVVRRAAREAVVRVGRRACVRHGRSHRPLASRTDAPLELVLLEALSVVRLPARVEARLLVGQAVHERVERRAVLIAESEPVVGAPGEQVRVGLVAASLQRQLVLVGRAARQAVVGDRRRWTPA